jgi:tetratricopeptide (TPR) repeat protein
MALDPYASCPCGSGKRFKWCCQPIRAEIDRAYEQHAAGQHDAALRTMEKVVADHPDNAEAFGLQAQLLHLNGRTEEAEAALQKAFALNPNYPFGLLLRGLIRQQEGELIGALILFRKAAEAYAPEAHDQLAGVYELIAENELKRNNPVAARAALQQSLRRQPANAELREGFENLFGENSRLPEAARREYRYLGATANAPADRKAAWDEALGRAATGRLSDAAKAFESLTQQDAGDAPAWFNLGLTKAWLGDNRGAVEAVERYIPLEADEGRAVAAATLGEVLRCGGGVEDLADVTTHRVTFRFADPQAMIRTLQEMEKGRRLIGVRASEEEGVLTGLVLEPVPGLEVSGATPVARLAAYLLVVNDMMSLHHTVAAAVDRVADEFRQKLGDRLSEPASEDGYVAFTEVNAEALVFPTKATDPAAVEAKMREEATRFYEETWIHRPLKSLSGVPPVDAAGSPVLRKKLLGAIRFREDCQAGTAPRTEKGEPAGKPLYDFDRLRHRLGLSGPPAGAAPDVESMSAADLAALPAESLSAGQLEKAFRAALKLDARDLAGSFARSLVGRPADAGPADRYPFYNHLAQMSLAEGDSGRALAVLEEGARADREQNEGRRGNEYDLKRGQVLAKRGEADAAQAAFEQLIARATGELKYLGSATEAMLSARQGARALKFAEQGLAQARQQNNRDMEQYFQELSAAAKKQGA